MERISHTGTFKATILEHTVNTTKKQGYPQFCATFHLDEQYDEINEEWIDWKEYNQGGPGYFVLYNEKGEIFHNKDVMAATGWDGISFADLDGMDLTDHQVQVRIEENEYNGITSMQIKRIDAVDAEPGVGLKKLDASEIKQLDKQFLGGKAITKPAKAPTKPPKAGGKKTAAKNETPALPMIPPQDTAYGLNEAWADIYAAAVETDGVKQSDVETCWHEVIAEVADGRETADLTPADWRNIVDAVKKQKCIPF